MKIRIIIALLLACISGLLLCANVCALDREVPAETGIFEKLYNETPVTGRIKVITYAELMDLRDSGEKFVLVDVLSCDDYGTGHIPGAISFPCATITKESALKKIPPGSNVVVYCLGSACHLSIDASCKLSSYGYRVLDYKNGLDEWLEKGNPLAR